MTSASADCMQSLLNPLHSIFRSQLYLQLEFSSSHPLISSSSCFPRCPYSSCCCSSSIPHCHNGAWQAHQQARDRPATQSACLNQPAPNMEEDKQTYTTHFLTQTWLCGPAHSEPCFPAYLIAGFDHILHFALYQMQQHWPQQSVNGPDADWNIAAAVGCVATEACRYSWCQEAETRLWWFHHCFP